MKNFSSGLNLGLGMYRFFCDCVFDIVCHGGYTEFVILCLKVCVNVCVSMCVTVCVTVTYVHPGVLILRSLTQTVSPVSPNILHWTLL